MNKIKYSICVCNLNMEITLERSLRSILNQIDNNYEVVVVDGGSTDNSMEILNQLMKEYSNLKVYNSYSEYNIGDDRNYAVDKSSGEYVILQMDCDDFYYNGIEGFVKLFHKIEKQRGEDFYFKGPAINICRKSFFKSIGGYRSLKRGEDSDLWRRLFSMNKIVWSDYKKFSEKIGYYPNKLKQLKNRFNALISSFQCGISYSSYVFWKLRNGVDIPFFCSLFLFLFSKTKEQFLTPVPFDSYGKLLEVVGSCSVET